jgi:hypothetical protein
MPTLRRILKFTPAVVLGMLVMAWVVNANRRIELRLRQHPSNPTYRVIAFENNSVAYYFLDEPTTVLYKTQFTISPYNTPVRVTYFAGRLQFRDHVIRVPLLALATALMPLAIGSLVHFHFRLWHYLVYTSMVAVELAYYLRWHL